jgi:transglutaminase-like putative cysteine protease
MKIYEQKAFNMNEVDRFLLSCMFWILLVDVNLLYSQPIRGVYFPEDVNAIIIEEKNVFEVHSLNKAIFKVRILTQVNNEGGREYGEIKLLDNQNLDIKHIGGKIFNVNGKELKKARKDDIKETSLSGYTTLYSDTRYKYLELSWPRYPYIVELTYEIELKSLYWWPSWYPQENVPVLKSSYTIILNNPVAYKTYPIGLEIQPRIRENVHSWELTDIPPRKRESYMPPESRIQKAILFSAKTFKYGEYVGSYDSWGGYARWYSNLLKGCYELTDEFKNEIHQLVADAKSETEKLRRLYRCLQDNTRYVAIHLGIGGIQPHSAESVCKNKYGDCKDLSTLMIAMTREVGMEAHPALVLTRDEGIVYPGFPSDQFNHVIACVPLDRDSIWIECTADNLALGELTPNTEGCNVLFIKSPGGKMVQTPQSSAEDNQMRSIINSELLSDGTLLFQGSFVSTGNKSISHRTNLIGESPDKQLDWLRNRILGRFTPQVKLESGDFQNLKDHVELPLESNFKGKIYKFGLTSGKRIFFNPALMHREMAKDIPEESERKFPIYYSYPFTNIDSLTIKLPSDYEMEAAPQIQDLEMSFGHYRLSYALIDNRLIYERSIQIDNKLIQPEDYEEYLSFIRTAVKMDNSKFVLRRKN